MPSQPPTPRRDLEAQLVKLQAEYAEVEKERRRWFNECQALAAKVRQLEAGR